MWFVTTNVLKAWDPSKGRVSLYPIKNLGKYGNEEIVSFIEEAYRKFEIKTKIGADAENRFYKTTDGQMIIAWRAEGTAGENSDLDLIDIELGMEMREKIGKCAEKKFWKKYPTEKPKDQG
jgi:hypothetical protein